MSHVFSRVSLIAAFGAVVALSQQKIATVAAPAVFGMIFTVLIALEFKHSLLVVVRNQEWRAREHDPSRSTEIP
jgi:hypothetical protein